MNKRLALVLALILAITIALPCTALGYEYDPTLSSDELAKEIDGDTSVDEFNQEEELSNNNSSPNRDEVQALDDETTTTTAEEETTSAVTESTTETTTTTTQVTTTAPYKGKNATRIPIITYHRLTSAKEKKCNNQRHSTLFLEVSVFKKQMKWLHKHKYRTISTEEFYLWYTGKIKLPKKSVLITFDDGSYSVIKYGLPILKKYNMKATIFMIGKYTRKKTNKKVHKNKSYSCIGRDVMKEVQETYPNLEFQSHTYNMHRKIGGVAALKKVSKSKQKVDFTKMYEKYGYTFMAYPYGKFTDRTIKAAKESHVKMAFAYGTNAYAKKSQSRYKIKRIKISAGAPMSRFTKWFNK
ncbi:MAG: hypothetical protein E7226_00885 [Clostridiales bacterium]|nr:hypothetical protein [Clostridiales bacterium]